ncbi:tetratricopeptide repeat protein [Paractinoplanes durhamensis]
MNDLAIAERAIGRHESALAWIRPAVVALETALGPGHPYTLSTRMNLALCEAEQLVQGGAGGLDAPRESMLAIAGTIERVFGADHPNTLRFMANLALMEQTLGDRTAEDRLAALRERIVARLGEDHPIVADLDRRSYLYRIIDPHQF